MRCMIAVGDVISAGLAIRCLCLRGWLLEVALEKIFRGTDMFRASYVYAEGTSFFAEGTSFYAEGTCSWQSDYRSIYLHLS